MILPPPLPDIVIQPIVDLALAEDFGRAGDITTAATIPPGTPMTALIRARQRGVLAGLDAAALTLRRVDSAVRLDIAIADGGRLEPGATIATLEGEAASILMAERVMLNFLGRLSGIATLTRRFADAIAHTPARMVCTRKTTPGLRALEKRAVVLGGGVSHRYGLDDAILIKDNHIAACGGVAPAIRRAKAALGHLRMIEVEVDTLDQLAEALEEQPHAILLDNMDLATLARAVDIAAGRCILEASGGVTLDTVAAIAGTGVHVISAGALTHSAPNLDLGLDVD